MARWKTLIHVHTDYSFDSDISLPVLAAFLHDRGFGCIAVTDHDTIEGARRLRGMTDIQVIIGEEVSTREGHLIGLFLKEPVRPGLSAADTARAIREQGGLVLLPHPFVKAFGCGLGDRVWRLLHLIDAVEVNNAQSFFPGPDRQARQLARETGLPAFVGADSHMRRSIAPCYQWMPAWDDPASFLAALRNAELVRGRHGIPYFVSTTLRVLRHGVGLPLPDGFGRNAASDVPKTSGRRTPALATANAYSCRKASMG
ncbi:MAG: PHP domain-containing protein [Planctomycetes bacterium]|nr:PHP domain-containing protein [Planctomycetota bacterium]